VRKEQYRYRWYFFNGVKDKWVYTVQEVGHSVVTGVMSPDRSMYIESINSTICL
jgi:hypothetical protein